MEDKSNQITEYDDLLNPLIDVEKDYKKLLTKYVKLLSWVFGGKLGVRKLLLSEIARWYLRGKLIDISNVMRLFLIERENKFRRSLDRNCIQLEDLRKNKEPSQLFEAYSILQNLKKDIQKQRSFATSFGRSSIFRFAFTGGIPTTGVLSLVSVLTTGRVGSEDEEIPLPPDFVQWILPIVFLITLPLFGILLGSYLRFALGKHQLGVSTAEDSLYRTILEYERKNVES